VKIPFYRAADQNELMAYYCVSRRVLDIFGVMFWILVDRILSAMMRSARVGRASWAVSDPVVCLRSVTCMRAFLCYPAGPILLLPTFPMRCFSDFCRIWLICEVSVKVVPFYDFPGGCHLTMRRCARRWPLFTSWFGGAHVNLCASHCCQNIHIKEFPLPLQS